MSRDYQKDINFLKNRKKDEVTEIAIDAVDWEEKSKELELQVMQLKDIVEDVIEFEWRDVKGGDLTNENQ